MCQSMIVSSGFVQSSHGNYKNVSFFIGMEKNVQSTYIVGFSRYLSRSAKGRRNRAVDSDLMPRLLFSIVKGIDQPRFLASSWERIKISRLMTFASALRAACAPCMTYGAIGQLSVGHCMHVYHPVQAHTCISSHAGAYSVVV